MKIFIDYLILSINLIAGVILLGLIGAAIWYGFTLEIGQPAGAFHLRFYLLPLRRFFL